MEIRAAHFKTKEVLFQFIVEILRKDSPYTIYYNRVNGYTYTVEYMIPDEHDDMYKVVKGKDKKGFRFVIGIDDLTNKEYAKYLRQGDILLYECEYEDKVWFTCPTLLAPKAGYTLGMTAYGSLSIMLKDGVIEKAIVR